MPAVVEGTHDGFGSGLLRIDFGEMGEDLEGISWEEFFKVFEENELAFIYQDVTEEGAESYACKFVARQSEDEFVDLEVEEFTDQDDDSVAM